MPVTRRALGGSNIDPLGEKVAGGLIKAAKITYGKANAMYG